MLAFAALVAMAGVAFASGGDDRGAGGGVDVSVDLGHVGHGHVPVANGEQVGGDATGGDATSDDATSGDATSGDAVSGADGGASAGIEAGHDGHGSTGGADAPGVNQDGGGVTASGVDIPPTPGEAPAPAASGPAPDAAGAAPIADAVVDALVVTEVAAPVAPGSADPVATDPPATAPAVAGVVPDLSELAGLAQVPELRSVGAVANGVTGEQSGPRELLSTGPGRSLMMVAVLLLAIGAFISAHRWMDRGDRKLAAARRGSDVARFR